MNGCLTPPCSRRRPCDDEPPRLKRHVGPTGQKTPTGFECDRPKLIGATIKVDRPATNSRDRTNQALLGLPPDATVDDAIERLVFLAKIDAGLEELDRGEGIPHDEVKRRLRV